MSLYIYGLITIVIGGLISLLVNEKTKFKIVSVFTGLGGILCSIPAMNVITTGETITESFSFSTPFPQPSVYKDDISFPSVEWKKGSL